LAAPTNDNQAKIAAAVETLEDMDSPFQFSPDVRRGPIGCAADSIESAQALTPRRIDVRIDELDRSHPTPIQRVRVRDSSLMDSLRKPDRQGD